MVLSLFRFNISRIEPSVHERVVASASGAEKTPNLLIAP
jgi:predicted HicB family RNase H-like nuclease